MANRIRTSVFLAAVVLLVGVAATHSHAALSHATHITAHAHVEDASHN